MLGKSEGKRSGQQRMRWLDGITDSMNMMKDRETWCVAVHGRVGQDLATEKHLFRLTIHLTTYKK